MRQGNKNKEEKKYYSKSLLHMWRTTFLSWVFIHEQRMFCAVKKKLKKKKKKKKGHKKTMCDSKTRVSILTVKRSTVNTPQTNEFWGICCAPHLTGKYGTRPFYGGSGRRAVAHTRPAFSKNAYSPTNDFWITDKICEHLK